ncbi:hypothetical protein JCM39194_22670 [Desulfotomaculum varum]
MAKAANYSAVGTQTKAKGDHKPTEILVSRSAEKVGRDACFGCRNQMTLNKLPLAQRIVEIFSEFTLASEKNKAYIN